MAIERNPTRRVPIGQCVIGDGQPIAVQSMTSTRTRDRTATLAQLQALQAAGADLVRVAVDHPEDAAALIELRAQCTLPLSVDLQENYRLAERLAPHVDKLRYNPGHLHHHERNKRWQDKVAWLAELADRHDCALRIGLNGGSPPPDKRGAEDPVAALVDTALEHSAALDDLGFTRYCVSIKDSDPAQVVAANRRFADQRPEVPLHLGVTEAGLPPEAIDKTRIAFEPLIAAGIGDTLRVSLTLPDAEKQREIAAGRQILEDIQAGRVRTVVHFNPHGLNLISCPSCARVENGAFVDLAERVRERTRYAADHALTIAVMGCRVNGPGETDDADLGLWCGPNYVNLKCRGRKVGAFRYDQVLDRLDEQLKALIAEKA